MAMLRIDDSSPDNDGMLLTSRHGPRSRNFGHRASKSNRPLNVGIWKDILPAALVTIEGLQVRPPLDQPSKFVVV